MIPTKPKTKRNTKKLRDLLKCGSYDEVQNILLRTFVKHLQENVISTSLQDLEIEDADRVLDDELLEDMIDDDRGGPVVSLNHSKEFV